MGRYASTLAERMGWCPTACGAIGSAAPMHDIGKIGIPDCILLKPGALDEAEWAEMRRHPERGAAIIGEQGRGLMQMAARIALSHHEKWDGSGYPRGLKGEAIPIEGRIVAIADVFDALLSRRPYKEAWPLEKVTAYLAEQAGRHFDPEIVPIFMEAIPRLIEIRAEFPD
jgi:putative two-component system response regulator